MLIQVKNNKIQRLEKQLIAYKDSIEIRYDTIPVIIRDSIPVPVEVPVPGELEYLLVEKDLTKADSLKIFNTLLVTYKDYNMQRTYIDTVKNDNSAFIAYNALVQKNRLKDIQFEFQNRYPQTITKTNTIYKTRTEIYMGIDGSYDGFSLGLGLKTKKGMIYKAGYNPFDKTFSGGIYTSIIKF